jgi:serine phosphatase RsbU (regulator of sigma subunit)
MPTAEALKEIDKLLVEANQVRNKKPGDGMLLAERAREMAVSLGHHASVVRAMLSIVLTHQTQSRFTEALAVLNEAHSLTRHCQDESSESDVCSGFGNVYYYMGDNDRALKYHLEGLRLREKLQDPKKIAFSINSVGVIYATMKNYTQAEEYFKRSMESNRKLNEPLGAKMAMNNLAVLSTSQKKFDQAIRLLRDALPGSENLPNDTIRIELIINLGIAYREKRRYKDAEKQFRIVLEIVKGRRNLAEAKVKEAMARLFSRTGRHKEAKKFSREAFSLFKKLGVKDSISTAYRLLGEVEKHAGDLKKSVHYLEKHLDLAEKLHEEEMKKKAHNLALAFQAENLKKENEINYLRNVELKQAYDQINEKNSQLIDSIQYARYFQELVFTPYRTLLSLCMKNSFLLQAPKDIVSGDFFWCYADGKKILLVMADCTGHGVPGAFVSLMGNSLLSGAVHERKILSPSGILGILNSRFYEMDSKEGMDLTIALIDKAAHTVECAGINAGLCLLRQGREPVNFKGSPVLLGKDPSTIYESHTETFAAGDHLYLFTDGFHTQKGGPSGKKLLRNTFIELLQQVSRSPVREQKTLLEQRFEEWKGMHEQQDDVSVAGCGL